jgi:hypothetical protein
MSQISLKDICCIHLLLLLSPVFNVIIQCECTGYFVFLARNTTVLLGVFGTLHLYNWLLSNTKQREVVPSSSEKESKGISLEECFPDLNKYDSYFKANDKWGWVYTCGFYLGFLFAVAGLSSPEQVVDFILGFGFVVSSLFFTYLLLWSEYALIQLKPINREIPGIQLEPVTSVYPPVLHYIDLERKYIQHTFPSSRVVIAYFLAWWLFPLLSYFAFFYPIVITLSCLCTKHHLLFEVLAGTIHSLLLGGIALLFV